MKLKLPKPLKRLWSKFKKAKRLKRWLKRIAVYGGGAFVLLISVAFVSLPSIDELNKFVRAPSVLIKAEDGKIIGSFGQIYGSYIAYEDLPASLKDAVIATEDRNFYSHPGIDIFGLMRATLANLRAGRVVQGGSTITQQVAKNVFLTPERSLWRKLREMLLAISLERKFSKEEILSIYLNRVYMGAGNYGVDSASRRYFGKSARALTLPESAVLAGLLKAPSRFAPHTNPEAAKQRAEQVLRNMEDAGYLTKPQLEKALKELASSIGTRQRDSQSSFYFADWIMDQLPEYVGNIQDDLVVTTTFRPEAQAAGDKAIAAVMDEQSEHYNVSQAALLAMTPDGAVRAMIGGRNYAASQYNRATQALRQPGSSFKLFVYLAALEAGFAQDTLVEDEPITLPIVGGTWTPNNYTHKYLGTIPLSQAVAESVNTVAVLVSQQVGIERVIDMAHRLGIGADILPVPSVALGAVEATLLEMTAAYAHLAAGGLIVYPYGIVRIETDSGQTLYSRRSSASGVVLRPDVVGRMNDLLQGVIAEGTGRGAAIGRPAAGKTGTTSDYRDAWFIGYTPEMAAGVWVGNDNNAPMKKVTGGMLPASIWRQFMQAALAGEPASSIPTTSLPSPLPWQQDMTNEIPPPPGSLPWQDEAPRQPLRPKDDPAEPKKDVRLGPEFWNKLMGGGRE